MRNYRTKKIYQQLIESEKFSAVGKLTAGVAHEFNNLSSVDIEAAK